MFGKIISESASLLTFLGVLLLAIEIGFRLGRRRAEREAAPAAANAGAIAGAMLGLLGLLLGFSFAGAAGRFLDRQDLIVTEANAIGTAYLRADLLNQPHQGDLKKALADYTRYRIEVSTTMTRTLGADVQSKIAGFHNAMWSAAHAGVEDKPATMLAVLNPVNDVIDLHSTRIAAGRKHLPPPLVALLMSCAVLSMSVIGFTSGLNKRRMFVTTGALAFLVATALWITVDLDHPRQGLIHLSDAPLADLAAGMLP